MADALLVRCIAHPDRLVGVATERPLAIHMLSRLDGSHDGQVVIGHLHADRDHIDLRMLSQLGRVTKRQRYPVMPRRCLRRILPRCANSADLEIRKRVQGRNMGDGCKPSARICPDNAHADLSIRQLCLPYQGLFLALHELNHDPFRSADEGEP